MELPNDIQLKIISKLDIDTRRALGIYSKLQIPKHIKDKLEKTIPSPHQFICSSYSRISLGDFNKEKDRFKYVLHRNFGSSKHNNKNNMKLPYVSYRIEHYGYNNSTYIRIE